MKPGVMLFAVPFLLAVPASASPSSFHLWFQDSTAPQSPALSKKSGGQESQPGDSLPEERKKAKKVWTNDNLNEVSGSAVSQVGNEKNPAGDKNGAAKPPSSQVVANFRKQLAALQVQLANVEKQIADLKSFSKGEGSSANGLVWHKSYSMEPIEDQIRRLEEKKKQLAGQIDTIFDAARKLGIEPGQLR
jgi:hypothetical protein